MSQRETINPDSSHEQAQTLAQGNGDAMLQMLTHLQRLNLSTHLGLGLAHQINHPLSASVNYTQCCIKLLQDENFDRNELLGIMTRACQETYRASEMIRRLRRFVSHAAPRFSTLNFNHVVLESVALLGPLFKEHQVDLQLDLHDDLPLLIGDRIQLEQIIFNLLLNAIQSLTGERKCDPKIVLTTHDLPESRSIRLCVRDNGPGIDDDMFPRLFEPFVTSKPDCLGIGLALCQSICKAHHGQIQVQNLEHDGCLISVLLPLAPSVTQPAVPVPDA